MNLWRVTLQFNEMFPGQNYTPNKAFYDKCHNDGFIICKISNYRYSTITVCQPGEIFLFPKVLHYFVTITRILDLGKNHQWVLKLSREQFWGHRILTQLRESCHRLLSTKRKGPLTWIRLADVALTKWSHLPSPVMEQTASPACCYDPSGLQSNMCHLNVSWGAIRQI